MGEKKVNGRTGKGGKRDREKDKPWASEHN